MHALGHYIIRGRLQAIGVISLLTIVSLMLPALAYPVSGAPAALVVLRRGGVVGLEVIAGSILFTLLLTMMVNIPTSIIFGFTAGVWLPLWCSALVLRMTESQGKMVLSSGVMGMLLILLFYIVIGDTTTWWREFFTALADNNFTAAKGEEVKQKLESLLPMMNAYLASGIIINLVLTTLLSRWWQSRLFNPGGFRQEFHQLYLPRVLIYPTLIGSVVWMSLYLNGTEQGILRDLLYVMLVLYMFHGVAAVHRVVRSKGLSIAWLVGMYLLIILLLPTMIRLMACIGIVDSWIKGKSPRFNGGHGD